MPGCGPANVANTKVTWFNVLPARSRLPAKHTDEIYNSAGAGDEWQGYAG